MTQRTRKLKKKKKKGPSASFSLPCWQKTHVTAECFGALYERLAFYAHCFFLSLSLSLSLLYCSTLGGQEFFSFMRRLMGLDLEITLITFFKKKSLPFHQVPQ